MIYIKFMEFFIPKIKLLINEKLKQGFKKVGKIISLISSNL